VGADDVGVGVEAGAVQQGDRVHGLAHDASRPA
jgi:hypothetical protein